MGLPRVIAASVCDHRLSYNRARRTDAIATLDFLDHVLGGHFQQAFFAFGHPPWLDIENAERANRKVVAAEREGHPFCPLAVEIRSTPVRKRPHVCAKSVPGNFF